MQGLTQHFEQMSMRNATNPVDVGHIPEAYELVPTADRHHGTRLFNWTLNLEVVFSAALTGKPRRKQFFSQYC